MKSWKLVFAILIIGTSLAFGSGDSIAIAGVSVPIVPCRCEVVERDGVTGTLCSVPEASACYYQVRDGVFVVNGHNPGVFGFLPGIKKGDSIAFNAHTYTVSERRVLRKTDHAGYTQLVAGCDDHLVITTCLGKLWRLVLVAHATL